MTLSQREQEILAAMEAELSRDDADLAAASAVPKPVDDIPLPVVRPTLLRLAGLLLLGLLTVIVLGVIVLNLAPIGLGVLTLSLITPWLLLAARDLSRLQRR